MRTIEWSSAFKRDYKRAKEAPRHRKNLDSLLSAAVTPLLAGQPLPRAYRDPLIGDWAGYRECHPKPDLLIVYRKPDAGTLRLARLGSHRELFG
jgi:mRNA interferase YafQ